MMRLFMVCIAALLAGGCTGGLAFSDLERAESIVLITIVSGDGWLRIRQR